MCLYTGETLTDLHIIRLDIKYSDTEFNDERGKKWSDELVR